MGEKWMKGSSARHRARNVGTLGLLSTLGVALLVVAFPGTATASGGGFGTFGGTARAMNFDGMVVVNMTSACPTGNPTCFGDGSFTYGYVFLKDLHGATMDQVTALSTDYYVYAGDCGGGSPRFAIFLSNGAEVWGYIGPAPDFTGCAFQSWQSTGNLVTVAGVWDSSELSCGAYGSTFAVATACADSLGLTIVGIQLVVDGGWQVSGLTQTILFNNVAINTEVHWSTD